MTDYAMLIMSQMAKAPTQVLSAATLALALHLSAPTVSKILKILAEAQLVVSLRGAGGGYRLAKPAEQISIVDIISAMEGGLAFTECCEISSLCVIDSMCMLRDNWRKINREMSAMLSQLSIADMQKPLPAGLFNGVITPRGVVHNE